MGTSSGPKEHCIGQGRQDVHPLAACHLIRDGAVMELCGTVHD